MIYSIPIFNFIYLKNWINLNKLSFKDKNVQWHNSGAEALGEICKEMIFRKRNRNRNRNRNSLNLLLPGFFCGQTLRFLRFLDIRFYFYSIGKDLTPNIDDIENQLNNTDFDIILLVHYFGKNFNFKKIKKLSNLKKTLIVEDCAHLVSPHIKNDFIGDILIFCPHKLFPVPKIALTISKKDILKRSKKTIFKLNLKWFLKQILKTILKIKYKSKWGLKIAKSKEKLSGKCPNDFFINTTCNFIDNFREHANLRSKNYKKLLLLLNKVSYWKPLLQFKDDEFPYLLPMVCDNKEISKKRFTLLNKEFSLVMQWPDLPKELMINAPSIKKDCIDKYNRTLFFFIHHEMHSNFWLKKIEEILSNSDFK